MAFTIIWSEAAAEDLKEIVQYVAMHNRTAAASLAEGILARIETASHFPWANRIVPEKHDQRIREAILKPYRIIFFVDRRRQAIHVVRIWHSSRGIPQIG